MKTHDTLFDGEQGGLTACLMKFERVDGVRRRVRWDGVHTSEVKIAESRLEWHESCQNGKSCNRCMDHHDRMYEELGHDHNQDSANTNERRRRKFFTCTKCRVKQPIDEVGQWQRFKALCLSCYNEGYHLVLYTDSPLPPRRWWVEVKRGRYPVSQFPVK